MASITDVPDNEPSTLPETMVESLPPGTTIPDRLPTPLVKELATTVTPPNPLPLSIPGPLVNNRPTTLTLYSPPSQLQTSPCIPSLMKMINASFGASHEKSNTFPAEDDRLRDSEQYYHELGNDPATFVYILTYQDSDRETAVDDAGLSEADQEPNVGREGSKEPVVIATCAAMRFYGPAKAMIKQPGGTEQKNPFHRICFPDPRMEVWEMRHLAVDVNAQKQGLAGYLVGLVEEEVRERFRRTRRLEGSEGPNEKILMMWLTTMKEANETFYAKRGYAIDDETRCETGHMGTRSPFTVVFMSKKLEEIDV